MKFTRKKGRNPGSIRFHQVPSGSTINPRETREKPGVLVKNPDFSYFLNLAMLRCKDGYDLAITWVMSAKTTEVIPKFRTAKILMMK